MFGKEDDYNRYISKVLDEVEIRNYQKLRNLVMSLKLRERRH